MVESETIKTQTTSLGRTGRIKWLIGPVAIVILLVLFYFVKVNFLVSNQTSGEYQAVFLNNGQVYFGKLKYTSGWIKLTDVYYLQVTDPLQPTSDEGGNTEIKNQQNIQLIKLGSELHGPQDEMFIAKDKVMFWENMKDDSKVLQSIRDYKLKNNGL